MSIRDVRIAEVKRQLGMLAREWLTMQWNRKTAYERSRDFHRESPRYARGSDSDMPRLTASGHRQAIREEATRLGAGEDPNTVVFDTRAGLPWYQEEITLGMLREMRELAIERCIAEDTNQQIGAATDYVNEQRLRESYAMYERELAGWGEL